MFLRRDGYYGLVVIVNLFSGILQIVRSGPAED